MRNTEFCVVMTTEEDRLNLRRGLANSLVSVLLYCLQQSLKDLAAHSIELGNNHIFLMLIISYFKSPFHGTHKK